MTVYGRKIPLEKIRQQMNKDQTYFLRRQSYKDYDSITEQEIKQHLEFYDIFMPESLEETLENLEKY